MPTTDIYITVNTSESGITAHAGGGQGSAYALTKKFNRVDTVATDGDSVKCFQALENKVMTVQNNTLNAINLFPFLDDNFLGQAANSSFYLAGGQQITLFCYDDGEWTIS